MNKSILSVLHNPPLQRSDRCEEHGEYLSRCFVGAAWTRCPYCSALESDREQRQEADRQAQARLIRWREKLETAAIPPRFQSRSFDNFIASTPDQVIALEESRGFVDRFEKAKKIGQSLVFYGGVGTGKTHLACAIGMALMNRGYRVLFSSASQMLRSIKQSWSEGGERATMDRYVEPDLLIIDEVGVQYGSATEMLLLTDIIGARYEQMLPTIFLTNLDIVRLGEVIGERLIDRLRECDTRIIPFDWASYRGKIRFDWLPDSDIDGEENRGF